MCMVRCTVSTGHLGSVTMLMNKKRPFTKSIPADKQFSTKYFLKKIYFWKALQLDETPPKACKICKFVNPRSI